MTEETKQIWNEVHFWTELIYFVSGIVLCVIAAIGLRQLKIAKRSIVITSKREAVKLASEQCLFYATEVIPKIDALDKAVTQKNIRVFLDSKVVVEDESIRVKSAPASGDIEKMQELAVEFTSAYNCLETFSVFFVSRVADENVAFDCVGHTFCRTVRKYMPDLLLQSENGCYYKDILTLFLRWNSRLEIRKLAEDKRSIEKRLEELNDKPIRPIGAD